MKKMKKHTSGFTLIELIVVLVILGILVAVSVPAFSGYLNRQKEKEAISECRLIVAATQSAYMDIYAKNDSTLKPNTEEILKEVGVDGKIIGADFDEKTRKITTLTYLAENKLCVLYRKDEDVKYVITDDQTGDILSNLEKFIKNYQDFTVDWLSSPNSNKYAGRETLTRLLIEKYGLLPSVDSTLIPDRYTNTSLYWQPYYIANNKTGLQGSTSTLLLATPNDGSGNLSNIQNSWKAYMIYFEGVVYVLPEGSENAPIGMSDMHTVSQTSEGITQHIKDLGFVPAN
ncbi:hypothetical protein GCM10008910_24970 [Faecalicatena orotica]|uniref:Prepilin-type N-terminal cleavage/methylation domain-containing protein n=2 Tax=Faecalicatena orotica TaxID=1544 RepID=A0A2Y9BGU1_9FIRM|nr:prepilin-type N-terminal cleavage/methylation domain-containing protein [Faecalicatena orotica]SSA56715.1 prepilin-type N-terminal cleavage/methylation domain-containing protein [Faecalicatena orotica]